MKISYFPGCSLHSTATEYDKSVKNVFKHLNVELKELSNWNCCGSTLAQSTDPFMATALPASNLAIAEKEGLDVMTPCAICFNRFKQAQKDIGNDTNLKDKVGRAINMKYKETVDVYSPINLLTDRVGIDAIKENLVTSLKGLRVAAYYGCLLVRPDNVTNFCDDPENPMLIENIMNAMDAEAVNWSHKVECCGGALAVSNVDIVVRLIDEIFRSAEASKAHCILTACPLCQTNLEIHKKEAKKEYNGNYNIPVYYFTELLEAGFGLKTMDIVTTM